jgi:hypothetical protein
VAALLITLGCILAPVAVLGIWAANQVSNTDRYVATMAPLISEPPIQHALSDKITARVTSRLDAAALTDQVSTQLAAANLPRLATLVNNFSGPIASGINGFVAATVTRVVASPAVATLWTEANRTAHQGVVKVLSGQGNGSLSVVNDQVVLNIGPIVAQVKDQLIARGLSFAAKIPTVNATFPLFEAPNLQKAQAGYRLINTLRWVLPVLSLGLMGIGIFIAKRRRRGLLGAALGLSASMLVLAAALTIARAIYLNSVPSSVLPSDAAAALYDTLVRFIREGLRIVLVVGLIVAAGAFLAGPSTTATAVRKAAWTGIDWVRARTGQASTPAGPVRTWVSAHKTVLRAASVAVVVLIFVFWGQPSMTLVIWLVVLLLIALGVIELLGGRVAPAGAPAAAAAVPAGGPGTPVPPAPGPKAPIPQAPTPQATVPQPAQPEPAARQETVPQETVPQQTVPQETVPQQTVPQPTAPEPPASGQPAEPDAGGQAQPSVPNQPAPSGPPAASAKTMGSGTGNGNPA